MGDGGGGSAAQGLDERAASIGHLVLSGLTAQLERCLDELPQKKKYSIISID